MPRLIADTDFGLEDAAFNTSIYQAFMRTKPQPYLALRSEKIQLLKSKNHIGPVNTETKKILYYMDLSSIRKGKICLDEYHSSRRVCKQMRVWRSPDLAIHDEGNLTQIPRKIFFDQLNHYDIIISDQQQTDDGKRFWKYRLNESLLLGYEVFFQDLHQSRTHGRIKITSTTALQEYMAIAWGNDLKHQGKIFLIRHQTAPHPDAV